MFILFQIIILLFSAIIHEWAHGYAAYRLGDDTAKQLGRLSLNPLVHLDIFGSIILPILLVLANFGFIFGYAKPVPFNPAKLRDWRYGMAKVAAAGPLSNLFIAAFLGLFLRFLPASSFTIFLSLVVYINILLAVFNLVPLPPLDGSKIIASFLPTKAQHWLFHYEGRIMPISMVIIFMFFNLLTPIMSYLFILFAGQDSLYLLFNSF